MALKHFCKTLQKCAEELEREIKHNLNEFHNQMFGKTMTETKLALERAKDYHFKEIIESIAVILKNIEIIVFHQDKIEWLGHEDNFTSDDLKRFSYVKRQVFVFTKEEEKPKFSRSEENLAVAQKIVSKRERRRTASEMSIGTLDAWEKYLDKKENIAESNSVEEIKKDVPKRTSSNARVRKKFVSSTMGGFLDNDISRRRNLNSIVERSSVDEDIAARQTSEEKNIDVEDEQKSIDSDTADTINGKDFLSKKSDVIRITSKDINNKLNKNIIEKESTVASANLSSKVTNYKNNNEHLFNKNIASKRELMNEVIVNDFMDFFDENVDKLKPKIVDVVYKQNPS